MYNINGSSFGTSLTLQPSNSFRDVSFSSYLNKGEENMIRKLTNQASNLANDHHCRKKPEEEDDEELGVFGAEKYFKEEIEDVGDKIDHRFNDTYDIGTKLHQHNKKVEQIEEFEEFDHSFPVKLRIEQTNMHTPSVRSYASGNSRTGLLPRNKPASGKTESGSKTKHFLASFACNCINKKSTQINEKRMIKSNEISKLHTRMPEFGQKTDRLSTKSADRKARSDYFSFPVLNSNNLNSNHSHHSNSDRSNSNSKYTNLAGKVVGDNNNNNNNNNGSFTLGRKLSLLNDWDDDDDDVATEDQVYIPAAIGMYNNKDFDSDSSSDLFEIESLSTNGNDSFIANRKSNCYAPSEVSVDWSVVTASAADFSVVSDYSGGSGGWRFSGRNDEAFDRKEDKKKRNGVLSGCTSYKAVRVAGDECKVGGGGGGGGRRRLSESMAVGSLFRGGMI